MLDWVIGSGWNGEAMSAYHVGYADGRKGRGYAPPEPPIHDPHGESLEYQRAFDDYMRGYSAGERKGSDNV